MQAIDKGGKCVLTMCFTSSSFTPHLILAFDITSNAIVFGLLIHPKNKRLNCYQPWLLYEYRKLIIYISIFLIFLHSSWIIAWQFSLKKWMLFNFKSDEKKKRLNEQKCDRGFFFLTMYFKIVFHALFNLLCVVAWN